MSLAHNQELPPNTPHWLRLYTLTPKITARIRQHDRDADDYRAFRKPVPKLNWSQQSNPEDKP